MTINDYSISEQFIDLGAQQRRIRQKINEAISKVLDHGIYIMGPEVHELERKLREFTGASSALTCANGTDAISLVLMAWDIGPGDVVFVPSFTYVASAEAPAQLGATPFFVDVDEYSFNICPESLKQAIVDCKTSNLTPKAIIAVDMFGQPADIDVLQQIANQEGLKLLVDGAQSFGATLNGKKVGAMGDATTTSFFPAKPLGCYGDGGAVFVNDEKSASIIASIRLHGRGNEKYDNVRIGMNSRLDTIQAAILIEKLKIFENELVEREKLASAYSDAFKDKNLITPTIPEHKTSAWAQYTLRSLDRDSACKVLGSVGIKTGIYYPKPLHEQVGYQHYPAVSSGLPISSILSKQVLSLPMHPYIADPNRFAHSVALALETSSCTKV